MCDDRKPNVKEFLANLSTPMPFTKKITLVVQNNIRKILTRRSCCGNHGEPGC